MTKIGNMYDTVNIIHEVAGGQLPAILNRLENITEHVNDQRQLFTGYLDNYKVTASAGTLWMKGSLAKFHLGDNISTLTRSETARAVEHLSEEIGVSLEPAKVTRIDLAANLLTNHLPETYYPFLIECQSYNRSQVKNSLYFSHDERCLIFYNKIKEATANRVTIPEVVKDGNLLRYELRILKRVNRQLNADVTAGTLSNERFYMDLVKRWHAEYKRITKQQTINYSTRNMKSPNDFWRQSKGQYLHLIGLDAAMKMVDQLKSVGAFERPEYYSRLRRQIRELYSQEGNSEVNSYIQELDQKVERMAKHFH